MKKIGVILVLIGAFTMNLNAETVKPPDKVDKVIDNTSKAVERVYNDGTKVIDKAYESSKAIAPKLEQALKVMGTELKVGADKVWNILVKQQLVWSFCFLILTISGVFNWIMFYKKYLSNSIEQKMKETITKKYREGYTGREDYCTGSEVIKEYQPTNPNSWFIGFHLLICLILSFFSFIHFTDMLTGFINPEFGAMKTIAEIASQIK